MTDDDKTELSTKRPLGQLNPLLTHALKLTSSGWKKKKSPTDHRPRTNAYILLLSTFFMLCPRFAWPGSKGLQLFYVYQRVNKWYGCQIAEIASSLKRFLLVWTLEQSAFVERNFLCYGKTVAFYHLGRKTPRTMKKSDTSEFRDRYHSGEPFTS